MNDVNTLFNILEPKFNRLRNALESSLLLPADAELRLELLYELPAWCGPSYFAQVFEQYGKIHAIYVRPEYVENNEKHEGYFDSFKWCENNPYKYFRLTCGKLLDVFKKSVLVDFCVDVRALPVFCGYNELCIDGIYRALGYYQNHEMTHLYLDKTDLYFFRDALHRQVFDIILERIVRATGLKQG